MLPRMRSCVHVCICVGVRVRVVSPEGHSVMYSRIHTVQAIFSASRDVIRGFSWQQKRSPAQSSGSSMQISDGKLMRSTFG